MENYLIILSSRINDICCYSNFRGSFYHAQYGYDTKQIALINIFKIMGIHRVYIRDNRYLTTLILQRPKI